jgi:hypothetical protein
MSETWPVICDDPVSQRLYERRRAMGKSHEEAVSYAAFWANRYVPEIEDGATTHFRSIRLDPEAHYLGAGFAAQVRYWRMRQAGQSHNIAEVLATRSFPGTRGTDRSFMQGRALDGSQFEGLPDVVGRNYVAQAADAGVNPAGRYYCGSVARFPGDPRAWVGSINDVKRICEAEGWTARGAVNVEPPLYRDGYVPPETYEVADELVERDVRAALLDDPGLEPFRDEIKAEIAKERAGIHGEKGHAEAEEV